LSAWRGLYRWWGQQGRVSVNPVDGIRAPKAAKPLPKASVDQAVALAAFGDPATRRSRTRRCMVELLYGSGLRVASWWADHRPARPRWLDRCRRAA
jgi:integrase/recombinase XerC